MIFTFVAFVVLRYYWLLVYLFSKGECREQLLAALWGPWGVLDRFAMARYEERECAGWRRGGWRWLSDALPPRDHGPRYVRRATCSRTASASSAGVFIRYYPCACAVYCNCIRSALQCFPYEELRVDDVTRLPRGANASQLEVCNRSLCTQWPILKVVFCRTRSCSGQVLCTLSCASALWPSRRRTFRRRSSNACSACRAASSRACRSSSATTSRSSRASSTNSHSPHRLPLLLRTFCSFDIDIDNLTGLGFGLGLAPIPWCNVNTCSANASRRFV